jgi:hypothetical protein
MMTRRLPMWQRKFLMLSPLKQAQEMAAQAILERPDLAQSLVETEAMAVVLERLHSEPVTTKAALPKPALKQRRPSKPKRR